MTTTTKNVENIIENGMMEISAYVLLNRALPDLRDGLKPVHRRILYTMYRQNAVSFTKSAHVSGEVMKIHSHGDSYGSIVGMVQRDRQLIPMVEGKGNFGQKTSSELSAAASRYTEIRLSSIAKDMMKDFDKNIVNFIDNYDGTIKMPEVLPVKFPVVLTYAQSGIGVGFSSSTASFNMNEVIDATIKYIQTKEHTELIPDFATGGSIIRDEETFRKINKEGHGSVQLRGTIEYGTNELIITEVPYTTTREHIISKIILLSKQGKLDEITDVKDLTGLKGMKISINCKKNTDLKKLAEKLYRYTPLQSSHSSNMNVLIDGLPKILSVEKVIEEWSKWRNETIRRKLTHEVSLMKDKLHLLRGLERVLLDIDKAIEIIRYSEEDKIEPNIMSFFKVDEVQAKEISNMRLRNINKTYILKKLESIEKFNETILEYEGALSDNRKIDQLVIKDLIESKEKYGIERRTKIIEPIQRLEPIRLERDIPDYPVTIHLTKEGYLYKFKGAQKPKLKPGDAIQKSFNTTNNSEVLVFDDENLCHKISLKDLEETRATDLGHYIPNILRKSELTPINYSVLDEKHKILIAYYDNNRIAKINLKSFSGNRRILKNAHNKNQTLVDLITLENEAELLLKTDQIELKINTERFTLTNSRGATGVYATRKGIGKEIKVV